MSAVLHNMLVLRGISDFDIAFFAVPLIKKLKIWSKSLHITEKGATFASLLKKTRGVAQLVRVRVWGA